MDAWQSGSLANEGEWIRRSGGQKSVKNQALEIWVWESEKRRGDDAQERGEGQDLEM